MQSTPDHSPEEGTLPTEIPYSDEAVLQGLIYPPPPSFYQNMSTTISQPALPSATPSLQVQAAYAVSTPTLLPVAPSYGIRPSNKQARKWIWLLVAIIACLAIATCALFGWSANSLVNEEYQQVSGSAAVVTSYYTAVQRQKYATAYSYLAPQGSSNKLTDGAFSQQTRTLDRQYGPIQSFKLSTPIYDTDTAQNSQLDLLQFIIKVDVKRTQRQYTASLIVQQINGKWKIMNFDKI